MLGLGFALVRSDKVYLVDCDEEALMLARENVDLLEEEELIGTRNSDDDDDDDADGGKEADGDKEDCAAVELIHAKVKYDPPRREKQGRGGSGRGHTRGGRGGRGKKGRGRGTNNHNYMVSSSSSATAPQNDLLYSHPNNNDDDGIPLPSKIVDTVITNPPFGTKNNEGIDVQFLKTAIRLAKRAVYSFHKTSTRPFLMKLLTEKWGLNAEVVAEMKFDIPNMYKFHKQKCVDVEVDLLRIFWEEEEGKNDGEKVDGSDVANNSTVTEDWQEEEAEMPLGLCGHS